MRTSARVAIASLLVVAAAAAVDATASGYRHVSDFEWVDSGQALALRSDVSRVEGNPQIKNSLPQPGPAVEAPMQPVAPATIEPGIVYTNAPSVWAEGFTGQNIVIASADTGVRWTHNALKPHYRGWDGVTANHDFNWHDSIHDSVGNPCGNNSPVPCDDFFHGSHTTGTAIGDDGAGNQIGMAPGAKWIACRNMDEGTGTPARYIECMEFFLAPTPVGGGQGDPTKAPDVTINSWGCPTSEGCSVTTLQSAVEAQAAAGIMMVVAAGNAGSACSTTIDPPSFYDASYTVGALNTSTDTIAIFSSRGPVTVDGSNRTKPDITAPGTNTRSATNTSDSAYTFASGTSMATPHIAGAVALLWSAHPELQNQIDVSQTALNDAAHFISSTQCGSAGPPNNVYGWGRVDILAAVDAGGGDITLTARARTRNGKTTVSLSWDPADGGDVNLLRNGSVVQTTPDDGSTRDNLGRLTGTFTYQVCETDSGDCSNEVDVTVP